MIQKNFKNISLTFFFTFFLFILPFISLAVKCNADGSSKEGTICNPISSDDVGGLIQTILGGVLKIGMPVIALAIIYCGFLFVSARGNPESITKAKEALLYTLIGGAVLMGSWALAQLITRTVLAL